MGKPSVPSPPNPLLTGALQNYQNISGGIANAYLNNVNQKTPQGNLTYTATGSYGYFDPLSGQTYQIPTFTAEQTLAQPGSPYYEPQQNNFATLYNQSMVGRKMSFDLMNKANNNELSVDPSQAPRAGDPYALDQQWTGGDPQWQIGEAGQQQGDLGFSGQQITGFDQTGMPIYGTLRDTGQQQYGFGNTQQGVQYSFDPQGHQQYGFDGAGNITTSYGPGDFSADRNKVEDALMQRLQPSLDQQRQRLEQQLADQGIRYGSEAYNNAMLTLNQQQTDARFAAINQAGGEQQRMMDMAAKRAGFENAAQLQAYNEAMGRGEFANKAQAEAYKQALQSGQFTNAAQQQEYLQQQQRGQFYNQAQQTAYQQALQSGQFANAAEAQAFAEAKARGEFHNAAEAEQYKQALQTGQFANAAQKEQFTQQSLRGQFANAAKAQQFSQQQARINAQNTARSQWLSEQYDKVNQPINQITALLSGSQVSKPSFVTTQNNQIANTDMAGIINNDFKNQMSAYTAQNNQFQQLMGGILGGFGGLLGLSDERAKDVGDKVGTIFAAGPDGEKPLPVYQYSYKADPASTQHVGPMAQDVEKIDPSAVKTIGGVKFIDKTRMGSILRPHVVKKAA